MLSMGAQGDRSEPGVVPRAVWDVFDIIEKTPGREFLLRLSMMEIYNEVRTRLQDLHADEFSLACPRTIAHSLV